MLSPASTIDDSVSSGHGAFLHRAAHDPQFRAALEANPQAALAEFGMNVDPEQIPSQVTIPSAERILDMLIDVEEDKSSRAPDTLFPWLALIAG